ncbi:hypothetical protein C0J52_01855 [Blattella germanica]|nr:hypothetical protein C0J52_01855 [Blattella germanica]
MSPYLNNNDLHVPLLILEHSFTEEGSSDVIYAALQPYMKMSCRPFPSLLLLQIHDCRDNASSMSEGLMPFTL